MDRKIMARAAVGAILIGTGLALMLSATRKITCEECGDEKVDVVVVEEVVPDGETS
jgi:hypothetical protein